MVTPFVQVEAYPTRNFAQSCYAPDIEAVESFLFRSPLHVAMQLGPYHSPTLGRRSGVWPLRILSLGTQAFLLIACTDRIVTHVLSTVGFTRVPSI